MAQIREVTFLPKEAPWEGACPGGCGALSTICLHGRSLREGREWSPTTSLPPSSTSP